MEILVYHPGRPKVEEGFDRPGSFRSCSKTKRPDHLDRHGPTDESRRGRAAERFQVSPAHG